MNFDEYKLTHTRPTNELEHDDSASPKTKRVMLYGWDGANKVRLACDATGALKFATEALAFNDLSDMPGGNIDVGTVTIDVTDTEALLVRKDSDGGDLLRVDTNNFTVFVDNSTVVTGATGYIENAGIKIGKVATDNSVANAQVGFYSVAQPLVETGNTLGQSIGAVGVGNISASPSQSGTVGEVIGGFFRADNGSGTSSMSITSSYGLWVDVNGGVGVTPTNAYGVYIGTILGTTKYGIYDASGENWVLDGDNQKIIWGEGQDGEIYSSGNDFHIHNVTQDADLVFGIDDGGVSKTITWDADVDKLKHSAGTFDFDNDIITTTGNITIDSDSNGLVLGDDQDANMTWDNANSWVNIDTALQVGGSSAGQSTIASGLVVNSDGGATAADDFRCETNTEENAFVVDASAEEILMNRPLIVDVTDTEAILVRQNADTKDIFLVDTTNSEVETAGESVFKPSATQTISAAGDTISANATYVVLYSTGNYTLTSAPTIAAGTTGQILVISGQNLMTNAVTLQDADTLASSNLILEGATSAISGDDMLTLLWNGTGWCEVSYSRNHQPPPA